MALKKKKIEVETIPTEVSPELQKYIDWFDCWKTEMFNTLMIKEKDVKSSPPSSFR